MTPALELAGIRNRYGALVAVDGASLTVRAGTIHALLGENGAGRSTLMRIAYGLEVIAISHRVVVMYDAGVREVARDREATGRAMLGAA